MTIQPFAKLRQILFSFETLFAISATNSELLKYSLIDEKITGNFTAKLPFMSLALNESHSRLLTINNEFVYLLDVSLSILAKMYTPSNPNHYCIVGMFFESWSVLLCEGFVAYADTGKTMVWNGKGVYDIQGQYMASGKRELLLWTQGNAKDGLELNTTEFDISLRDSDRE